jgi:hypothetical protein
MLIDCDLVPAGKLEVLIKEGHELSAIFTASRQTAKTQKK